MRSLDEITGIIVDVCYWVHSMLGPGLLESVYERVLVRELRRRGLNAENQVDLFFEVDGMKFERGLRVDVLVEDRVIVEIKSVESMAPVHFKQALSYLRLLDLRVGLLVNFNVAYLKDGLHRLVNGYQRPKTETLPDPRRLR